ncbi:MAG: hypothetical protein QOI53_4524 [Verrucomicrobiota bacterium]|nr:hypothetical protein [Verrucomicrobiota bacterium]
MPWKSLKQIKPSRLTGLAGRASGVEFGRCRHDFFCTAAALWNPLIGSVGSSSKSENHS